MLEMNVEVGLNGDSPGCGLYSTMLTSTNTIVNIMAYLVHHQNFRTLEDCTGHSKELLLAMAEK
jgi:hypothetical protein